MLISAYSRKSVFLNEINTLSKDAYNLAKVTVKTSIMLQKNKRCPFELSNHYVVCV